MPPATATPTQPALRAPFPWFGGKSRVAAAVWRRFGDVPNYVEPFFGSGAVLLARPTPGRRETVNDADGLLCNFWRALQRHPRLVAQHADNPVNENDLHARHAWLVGRKDSIVARLEGSPTWCDPQIAGWWVWGLCCWIGSGWCSGQGPWHVVNRRLVNRKLVHSVAAEEQGDAGRGVNRQLVHLGNAGQGVNRQLVHLGDAGRGVNRQLVHAVAAEEGDAGRGPSSALLPQSVGLTEWFEQLAARLRHVRVCCGDWSRVCGPTPTVKQGLTGVFLDPPYSAAAGRDNTLYRCEDLDVAHQVRGWCLEHGDDPKLRIALCGYAGEGHGALKRHGWRELTWKAAGGFANQRKAADEVNSRRERIWFSPHCL